MRSMTGHGFGEAAGAGGVRVLVDCLSVNRKQFEIQVNLSREYSAWEVMIRERVLTKVARGRVQVSVTVERAASASDIRLRKDAAHAAFQQMRQLQKELDLPGDIQISDLLAVPGIWQGVSLRDTDEIWPIVQTALHSALTGLLQMREREGKHLLEDLAKRLRSLKRFLARIRRSLPSSRKQHQALLAERLQAIGLVDVDDRRLREEVAWFCEKSDISEELTRLDSHLKQFEGYLHADGPIGRTLEFLAQEISREINTLSAKANNANISQLAVDCKAELDKIREQISNIE